MPLQRSDPNTTPVVPCQDLCLWTGTEYSFRHDPRTGGDCVGRIRYRSDGQVVMSVRLWSGDEWQSWCVDLIRRTYGANQVQPVPARHGGDLGIEAFTHNGHVFQCYVAQEPLTTKDRYESQRDKLTMDLAKLESKMAEFQRLLGHVRIGCHFFLVPYLIPDNLYNMPRQRPRNI